MKKAINFLFFILLFLATKELMYLFIQSLSNFDLITISLKDSFYFQLKIALISFVFGFAFLVFKFYFKSIKTIVHVLIYFTALVVSLLFTNYIFSLWYNEIYIQHLNPNLMTIFLLFVLFYNLLGILCQSITKVKSQEHSLK